MTGRRETNLWVFEIYIDHVKGLNKNGRSEKYLCSVIDVIVIDSPDENPITSIL